MRWSHLVGEGGGPAAEGLPLALPGAVVRTFDTPGFAGMTFFEVRAKSILNRVPGSSRMPFEWTLNPYRGCSHACVYCVAGDTPVLMADGRTAPVAELKVGDRVYGTVRQGSYRRYATTEVLAHWSTVKPAYRVVLEDGTELVGSGDHRFLTDRGWKFVTGRSNGSGRRPHLTTGNKLIGVGQFAAPPKPSDEYRRGYLCGMIRGDGHLGSYPYRRPGRTTGDVHRFRLALVDPEAMHRARSYLAGFGVPTDEFVFAPATGTRKQIGAIRTSRRDGVHAVRQLVAWPELITNSWRKGFLAGIFDAGGSHDGCAIRITNSDQEIIDSMAMALQAFGFSYVVEVSHDQVRNVRLVGGLPERLRFFHTVDPAITRKRTIDGTAVESDARLGVVSVEPLGLDLRLYDITTGTGDFIANGVISHNCFARSSHTYLDLDPGEDFDRRIVVKVNAGELLRRELAAPRWRGQPVAMGTNVDCYQRAEGRYRLMPEILAALRDFANPFSILTKGTLILRDLPLLREAGQVTDVRLAVSIGFLDETRWPPAGVAERSPARRSDQAKPATPWGPRSSGRRPASLRTVEPGTPSPRRRLDVVRRLSDAGFRVSVLMAPILPGLTDDDASIEATVAAIAAAGAASLTPLPLHLRPGAREWFGRWLARWHPELVEHYRTLYAAGAYAPKSYQRELTARVRRAARRHGLAGADDQPDRTPAPHRTPTPTPSVEQPTLW